MSERTFVDPWQHAEPLAPGPGRTILDGVWLRNPIAVGLLGICSALAVTNLAFNTMHMCLGLVWTVVMTNITVSALRRYTPQRVRMMVQVLIIACYVIVVDIALRALFPAIHRVIGPYVGLIITNCVIMGRADAEATKIYADSYGLDADFYSFVKTL